MFSGDTVIEIHNKIYNPFDKQGDFPHSNFMITYEAKISILTHDIHLGIINGSHAEFRVEISNPTNTEVTITKVTIFSVTGGNYYRTGNGFIIPSGHIHFYSDMIYADELKSGFNKIKVSFYSQSSELDSVIINLFIPEKRNQQEKYSESKKEANSVAQINIRKVQKQVKASRYIDVDFAHNTDSYPMFFESEYSESAILTAEFSDGEKIWIPPSGKCFSLNNFPHQKGVFRLTDDSGNYINSDFYGEKVLTSDFRLFQKLKLTNHYYFLRVKEISTDLSVKWHSDNLNIIKIHKKNAKNYEIVFAKSGAGEYLIHLTDGEKEIKIQLNFPDSDTLEVVSVPSLIYIKQSPVSDSCNLTIPIKIKGHGYINIRTEDQNTEHGDNFYADAVHNDTIKYNLTIPADYFASDNKTYLPLYISDSVINALKFDIKVVLQGRKFLLQENELGPVILSYGTVVEKQIKIILDEGEKIISCVCSHSDTEEDRINEAASSSSRFFKRLDDFTEYSFSDGTVVLRFSCFTRTDHKMEILKLNVNLTTNYREISETIRVHMFFYEGKGKFSFVRQDEKYYLHCKNTGDLPLIIYNIRALNDGMLIEHTDQFKRFPLKLSRNQEYMFEVQKTGHKKNLLLISYNKAGDEKIFNLKETI